MPHASVAINPQAYEGQRNTSSAVCSPAADLRVEYADLVIDVTQGTQSTTIAGQQVTCDGAWHKQNFSTPEEAWTPGPADVPPASA